MKLILTGATGFIGRNLAEYFLSQGVSVLALGRSRSKGRELESLGIPFTRADIRDPDQVCRAMPGGADCLIHCAGKMADWGTYDEFHTANVTGTRNIISACRKRDISRIIFISTPSVYFSGKDRYDVRESAPLPPRQFHYGKTKLMAEKLLLDLAQDGFHTMIFRPRAVYGPHDGTIVPRILKLAEKKRFPLINNGRALVDITYIGNLIHAVEKALSAPDHAWNEVYNIANGDPVSIRDWFAMVLDIFNRPFRPRNVSEPVAGAIARLMEWTSGLPFGNKTPAMTRFSVGYMAKSLTMSIEKAGKQLNYEPVIGNRQGFEIYRKWQQHPERKQTCLCRPQVQMPRR